MRGGGFHTGGFGLDNGGRGGAVSSSSRSSCEGLGKMSSKWESTKSWVLDGNADTAAKLPGFEVGPCVARGAGGCGAGVCKSFGRNLGRVVS